MVDPHPSHADEGEDRPEPPALRRLRWLVTVLTLVMIVGVVIIVSVLVLRIMQPTDGAQTGARIEASSVRVPPDELITATGGSLGTITLVTIDGDGVERLRIYDAQTGSAGAVVLIERAAP